MSVVPADKFFGGMAAGKVLARNANALILAGAIGEHDAMMRLADVINANCSSDLHVSDKLEAIELRDPLEDKSSLFQFWMIRGDSRTH